MNKVHLDPIIDIGMAVASIVRNTPAKCNNRILIASVDKSDRLVVLSWNDRNTNDGAMFICSSDNLLDTVGRAENMVCHGKREDFSIQFYAGHASNDVALERAVQLVTLGAAKAGGTA